jgi:hypothetical protein
MQFKQFRHLPKLIHRNHRTAQSNEPKVVGSQTVSQRLIQDFNPRKTSESGKRAKQATRRASETLRVRSGKSEDSGDRTAERNRQVPVLK